MVPGWAQNGRRPQREGLSLPFSATKVLHTFRSVTPGAAGGVVASKERDPEKRGTFDAQVKLRKWSFWRGKSGLLGSGYFPPRSKLIILIASPVGKVTGSDGEARSLSCVKSLGG